jgi:WD40 repeat protein
MIMTMQNITGSILAILSGNSVTTWEFGHDEDANDSERELQEPITRYPYGDLPIAGICWNHNRMVLAACSAVSTGEHEHDNVILISSQSGNLLDSFQHTLASKGGGSSAAATAAIANCLQFGGKSRYLCIGDESGAVYMWDLKKKMRVRQFLHPGHPCRQVSLDPTDSVLLSLSPHRLFLYNVREGKLINTIHPPGNDHTTVFTKYCTSTLEPSMVAVGTNNGSVYLYDISSRSDDGNEESASPFGALLRRHSGSVTGLAFSPLHSDVLVTSGSDGIVKMIDIRTGDTLQEIQNEELTSPINSLSLHAAKGSLCSIGCESGDVIIFDLDNEGEDAIVASMNVGGPVEQVAFIPPPRAKDQSAPQKTPAKSVNPLPMGPTPAKFRFEQGHVNAPTSRSLATSSIQTSIGSPNSSTVLKAQENIPSNTATPTSSSGPFPGSARKSPLSPRRTVIVQAARQNQYSATSKGATQRKSTTALSPGSPPAKKSDIRIDVNAQPIAIRPRSTFMKARSWALRQHLYSATSSSPQQENIAEEQGADEKVKLEDIREAVREEVENLQDEMEEQLRNLHMDMIAQFHQQSQEMNKVISHHLAAIDKLTEENQRLRQENDMFRLVQRTDGQAPIVE